LDPATDAIVIGNIVRNVPIQRGGKWAEHNFVNHGPIYPPWPQGSCGYMVSRAVGNYIAQQYDLDVNFRSKGDTANGLPNEPVLQMYQGEDTSLGIWMEQSNLNVSWINSSLFVNHGDCAVPSLAASSALTAAKDETIAWSIGHRITPEHMLRCYSVLSHAGANVDLDASTVSPKQVFALHSHVSTEPLEPSKDDKAYWSAMDLYQSDQEAKQRSDLLRQRREERAKRRQGLKADK
jgi:hypothetical protein